jgi:hypothetical protein
VTTLLASAACTGGGATSGTYPAAASPAQAGPELAWSQVSLPTGTEPVTVTAYGDRLLVGAVAAGTPPSPRMLTVDATGATTDVPLAPHSGYAGEARWYSVVTDGARILAIGGARGGAHANVRWTTWSGTATGVVEKPQSFATFGGWGAGDLVDAVITPGGDAIVGTWGGAEAGLDGAVWLRSDDVWTRQDPAGTALESTKDLLVGPRSATASGPGILVVGSALHLGAGSVSQLASLWRSSGPNAGWHRVDLPDSGRKSEAVSARCDGVRCVVAGQVDGALALWQVDGDSATRVTALPPTSVGESNPVPDPVQIGGHTVLVTTDAGRVAVLAQNGGGWARSAGPPGSALTAAVLGDRLYVVVSTGAGSASTLWQTAAP